MEEFKREVAYKIWIGDLLNGEFLKGAGQFDPNYLKVKELTISRVNLIASVIDKFSGDNYENFSLDDGSGIINLKSWGDDLNLFNGISVGDLVLVVGKIKEYNNNIFVSPEIIKKIDNPLWLKVRKKELINLYGEIKRVEKIETENNFNIIEEKVEEDLRGKVLKLISNLDVGEGADFDNIIQNCNNVKAKDLIEELIKEGEVFEIKKGKLKII